MRKESGCTGPIQYLIPGSLGCAGGQMSVLASFFAFTQAASAARAVHEWDLSMGSVGCLTALYSVFLYLATC